MSIRVSFTYGQKEIMCQTTEQKIVRELKLQGYGSGSWCDDRIQFFSLVGYVICSNTWIWIHNTSKISAIKLLIKID